MCAGVGCLKWCEFIQTTNVFTPHQTSSLCRHSQGKAPRSAAVSVLTSSMSATDEDSAAQLLSQAARPFCPELEELFLVLTMWVSPQQSSDEQHTERCAVGSRAVDLFGAVDFFGCMLHEASPLSLHSKRTSQRVNTMDATSAYLITLVMASSRHHPLGHRRLLRYLLKAVVDVFQPAISYSPLLDNASDVARQTEANTWLSHRYVDHTAVPHCQLILHTRLGLST